MDAEQQELKELLLKVMAGIEELKEQMKKKSCPTVMEYMQCKYELAQLRAEKNRREAAESYRRATSAAHNCISKRTVL